jgi:hypothetical protein
MSDLSISITAIAEPLTHGAALFDDWRQPWTHLTSPTSRSHLLGGPQAFYLPSDMVTKAWRQLHASTQYRNREWVESYSAPTLLHSVAFTHSDVSFCKHCTVLKSLEKNSKCAHIACPHFQVLAFSWSVILWSHCYFSALYWRPKGNEVTTAPFNLTFWW